MKKHSCVKQAWIVLVLLVLLLNMQSSVFARTENVYDEDDKYSVKLVRVDNVPDKRGERFVFSKYNKISKQYGEVVVENMMTKIEKVKVVKERLVIFGEVQNIATGISIVDLEQNKEVDFILGYRPYFSKKNRYIVFEKFYPRFAPPEVRSDMVLIYDLEQSPSDNRVGKIGVDYVNIKNKISKVGDPEYLFLSENAGHPVYPEVNVLNQTYNVWVDSEQLRHYVFPKGTYSWFVDDKVLVFLDKFDDENWVVVVDISKGLRKVNIEKIKIELVGDTIQ